MAVFTIEITDADKLAGITAARDLYNETAETPLDTDQEYVQFVMDRAAESYANSYVK
jgi:hypothetical protein